jgi:hypothetical protein
MDHAQISLETCTAIGLSTTFAWLIFGGNSFHNQGIHVAKVAAIALPVLLIIASYVGEYVDVTTGIGLTFAFLFAIRYVRFIINTISWALAKPYRILDKPTLTPEDVTVIIPSANPDGSEFLATVQSALDSAASKVLIVTFGSENMAKARGTCGDLLENASGRLVLIDNRIGNKRMQMVRGVQETTTKIAVFCDDHVFWPPGFLQSILAPFEDPDMGGVGTHKQVQRALHSFRRPNLANFFGCIYLDRHNAEILATNRLDGGVFIISSRTAAYRTEVLKDPAFQAGFLDEHIHIPFFGSFGPLNADDDNFMMRWLITHDKKIFIQNGPAALMHTTINNDWEKFSEQLLRWARTTWRSNPRSILEGKVMRFQPWSFYATNLALVFNFAAVWDPLLLWTLHLATSNQTDHGTVLMKMVVWILFSKFIKLTPFFWRNPADVIWFPVYVLGAYCHSFIKAKAFATSHIVAWGSRKNVA